MNGDEQMKINTEKDDTIYTLLGACQKGACIRFRKIFHSNFKITDPFLVVAVADCYRPEKKKYEGSICVVSLRLGRISYVSENREVILFPEAEVSLHET